MLTLQEYMILLSMLPAVTIGEVNHVEITAEKYNIHIKGQWRVESKLDEHRHKRDGVESDDEGTMTPVDSPICLHKSDLPTVHGKQNQKALVVDFDGTAVLACHLCGAPDSETHKAVLWYRFRSKSDPDKTEMQWQAEEVKIDTHDDDNINRVYVTVNHNLVIKDFQPADVGTYFCEPFQEGLDAITHYAFKSKHIDSTSALSMSAAWKHLTSGNASEIDFLYHLDIELPMKAKLVTSDGYDYPKPASALMAQKSNWVAFTEWEEWGECNVCGMPGEHRRRGHCMVRIIDPTKIAQPVFLDHILRFFLHGAPCHSSLFFNFADVIKREHETEIGKCEEDCPDSALVVPSILDVGKIQINSTLPKKAPKIVSAPTQHIKVLVGDPVLMSCPVENSTVTYKSPNDTDYLISWQNGSRPMNALIFTKRTRGRLRTNLRSDLNFTKVKKYDNSTYSCWQGETEMGRFVLEIEIPEEIEDIGPYLKYLGMSYAVDFVLFVIIAAVNYRKKGGQVKRTQTKNKK